MRSASRLSGLPRNSASSFWFGLISATPSSSAAPSAAPEVSSDHAWRRVSWRDARPWRRNHPARRAGCCRSPPRISVSPASVASLSRHGLPFGAVQRRARQHEAVLQAGFLFVSGKVFPRLDVRGRHHAVDAFALDQPMQQFADGAAGRVDRRHVAAQPVRGARHVDAAAAGVALGRRAAQLARRLDALDIDENVDGRINREGDDVWHALLSGSRKDSCFGAEISSSRLK